MCVCVGVCILPLFKECDCAYITIMHEVLHIIHLYTLYTCTRVCKYAQFETVCIVVYISKSFANPNHKYVTVVAKLSVKGGCVTVVIDVLGNES